MSRLQRLPLRQCDVARGDQRGAGGAVSEMDPNLDPNASVRIDMSWDEMSTLDARSHGAVRLFGMWRGQAGRSSEVFETALFDCPRGVTKPPSTIGECAP